MPHITDSAFLKDLYGTTEMREIFSDGAQFQKWLDFEVALAQAEAEQGMIPSSAAREIARIAHAREFDFAKMKQGVDRTLHPIVPLIRLMKDKCAGDAGEYIHYGATTQDVMDSAVALQLKDATVLIEQHLTQLLSCLITLAEKHKHTLMAGRTHGQQALPITFGYKVAVWADEIGRHIERVQQCKPRALMLQFGGAAGTLAALASYPEKALAVRACMAQLLGLGDPAITWHTAHDGFAEFAHVLALIAGSCGKFANEVIALQRTELWEVEEPFEEGKVGSSTMPHKRNPMLSQAIVALARLAFNTSRNGLDALIQDHERDWSANHIEWAFLPELCVLTDGALALSTRVLRDLHVHPKRMAHNARLLGGLMQSEAVMFALGKYVGKQTAHHIVNDCAMQSVDHGTPFRDTLMADAQVQQHLSPQELDRLLDPSGYTGLALSLTDAALAKARKYLAA